MQESEFSPKEKYFLYDLVKPEWNLKKDERVMIKKIIWSLVILLAIIDLMAISFYIKTRERIDYIQNHHFTQSLEKN